MKPIWSSTGNRTSNGADTHTPPDDVSTAHAATNTSPTEASARIATRCKGRRRSVRATPAAASAPAAAIPT